MRKNRFRKSRSSDLARVGGGWSDRPGKALKNTLSQGGNIVAARGVEFFVEAINIGRIPGRGAQVLNLDTNAWRERLTERGYGHHEGVQRA